MSFYPRIIKESIEKSLFKGKVIIIYGARQVGKTTLSKEILKKYEGKSTFFNCELLSVKQSLEVQEAASLKDFLGDNRLIVLDEAQNVANVGRILKIMVDTYPEIQIIATGSSSFDLANKTSEPLTGRAIRFTLSPLSLEEIKNKTNAVELNAQLENIMRFGTYPEVFFSAEESAKDKLDEIVSNYLYKDVLMLDGIKKPAIIIKLLQLLALQLGNEVSYNELATSLGINRLTVEKYIDLLEKCFVIFTLRALSRNMRKEISKSVKIYFYDLGIRNSLIQNYNLLEMRNDIGALWENLMIVEKIKKNSYHKIYANLYFWRTYDQKEIDLIEERDGKFFAYEFKWKKDKTKEPRDFLSNYANSEFEVVNRENYGKFLFE
ncbi:MAG: ATP-binding protein [Parcubacteria group bacterium]|jgi:hypothetical protein